MFSREKVISAMRTTSMTWIKMKENWTVRAWESLATGLSMGL